MLFYERFEMELGKYVPKNHYMSKIVLYDGICYTVNRNKPESYWG